MTVTDLVRLALSMISHLGCVFFRTGHSPRTCRGLSPFRRGIVHAPPIGLLERRFTMMSLVITTRSLMSICIRGQPFQVPADLERSMSPRWSSSDRACRERDRQCVGSLIRPLPDTRHGTGDSHAGIHPSRDANSPTYGGPSRQRAVSTRDLGRRADRVRKLGVVRAGQACDVCAPHLRVLPVRFRERFGTAHAPVSPNR